MAGRHRKRADLAVSHQRHTFRVFAERAADPQDPSGYAMPHSALTYLVRPDGTYAAHFPDAIEPDALAARLKELVS
jgi:protein SCO1